MAETNATQHSVSEAPAHADPSAPHTAIQSVAEPAEIPWDAPTLPKPNMPAAHPSAPWNTEKLGLRVGADALAAGAAGVLVAPIITIIDKGIIENASGRNALGGSLKKSARELLVAPHRFLGSKPFVLIFSLYFGTYFTANTLDTATSTLSSTPASTTTAGTPKFLATSSANLALCLYKDSRFTQLFGSPGSTRPVPLPTFALFTLRDSLTIFASFNLPPLLAPTVATHMGAEAQRWMSAASVAQFVTPAAVQVVSTPLHLLGLDLYNRAGVALWGRDGRARRVLRDWGMASLARMGRIVPAFGVGGVVNTKVRRGLMGRLE
ncbi:hypothetical protein PMIN02_003545 [Paraphaeosphaeria minitans]